MVKFTLSLICLILCYTNKAYSESNIINSKKTQNRFIYFVNGFEAKLYLYPDKSSEILQDLPYGTFLESVSPSILLDDPNWISIQTSSKLSGFVLSGEVVKFPYKFIFKNVSNDVIDKFTLIHLKKDANAWQQITNFLFQASENGDYTGEQYVFFRVFSGEALANAIEAMHIVESNSLSDNSISVNPTKQIESNDFLNKYKDYLTKDSTTNQIRLDENFFWKYASLNSNSKYAEIAGRFAMQQTARKDCKGEPICFLLSLNNREFRYLRFFPESKERKKLSRAITNQLEKYTKERELIACFLPQQDYNYQIFKQLKYNRYYIHNSELMKYDKYISIITEECFP
ncbi:MAG: hypothetical protein MH321_12575 [Leptospiraceae bacterium]|nr:hypothetical protein [Leptospiraceae bacterium]